MPKPKTTAESEANIEEEKERVLACPRCGSEIIDMSKGVDIGRCIVCKHIFDIETEESRRRKGKEAPHRIRRKPSIMALFKRGQVIVEEEEEDEEGKPKAGKELKVVRTKEQKTKLMVIGISVGLMIIFFLLAILTGVPMVDKVDENGEVVTDDLNEPVKEPLLDPLVLSKNEKKIELSDGSYETEPFYVQLDWLAFVMIGLMCGFGPIGIYEGRRNTKIVLLEERLADLLRDLAEASRSGQTLHEAIITASGGEYGELLPEIKHMARQISWGVSATEALTRFSERVKTPLVQRAVTLINEASAAGGDVSRVLEAAANDTKEIQMLQRERKIQMSLYVAVIFVSFVVFLVVILIVYATFVPQMKAMAMDQQATGDEEEGSETDTAVAETGAAFSPVDVDFDEIKLLFIAAALVHAIGDGVVAGLMGSGRMTDGLKLSFAMIMIVFLIFVLLMPAASIG